MKNTLRSEIKETDAWCATPPRFPLFFRVIFFALCPTSTRLSNLIHHCKTSLCNGRKCMQVVPSHNLAVLSWTVHMNQPQRPQKNTLQLTRLFVNRKKIQMFTSSVVYPQYTRTQPLFWQRRNCAHVSLDMCSWHLDVSLVWLYKFFGSCFKLYLLQGKTKLSYDKSRCSCPCIA